MKKTSCSTPLFALFISIIFAFPLSALAAEKIKVKRVKGNSALIESSVPLEEGQTYELALEPVSQDVNYKENILRSRDHALTFGLSYDYVKSDLLQRAALDFQMRYGWNFTSVEAGLILDISSLDEGNGATNQFIGGGYFDYNFVSNLDPKPVIYGAFVLAGAGTRQLPAADGGGSASLIQSNAGGFLTYFIGGTSTALRGEAYYNYQQINTSAVQNSVAGFGARGLLVLYF